MQTGKEIIIRLSYVNKTYHTLAGDFQALNDINAEFKAGEFVGIIGKSGAGKSTLVNMLTGVDSLSSGEVWIEGQPIHSFGEDQMAQWRGRHLGVVYQSFELISQLSVLNNVLIPMEFCGLYHPINSRRRALELLEHVELTEHVHKSPSHVSGGQQQRVAIARALANDPGIIVADEPTGNLDSITGEIILRMFEDLVSKGKIVIMVTHDKSLAARFDHLIRIEDGRFVEDRLQVKGGYDG
ncbi:MAG: ABC transporter ATP-binding protein [Anaerolineaceae bacterium]|nr:ABC transporter ATP-binding protein [Anaerolineaceae bacterium]